MIKKVRVEGPGSPEEKEKQPSDLHHYQEGKEYQLIPPLFSLAPELSPNAFSPPSQSSLSRRQTGHAFWHSLVRGSSNRPKLLQRLLLRSIAVVPFPTVFLVFFIRA